MKKIILVLIPMMLLTSCGHITETEVATDQPTAMITESITEKEMTKIIITIGDKAFIATLYDNETAKQFAGQLPLTLTMSELHGNEKYYYFDTLLPTSKYVPSGIYTGDIKLFGDNCLVLFYKDFKTSYSYTDIGKIDDPSGLAEALGNENITISFEKE